LENIGHVSPKPLVLPSMMLASWDRFDTISSLFCSSSFLTFKTYFEPLVIYILLLILKISLPSYQYSWSFHIFYGCEHCHHIVDVLKILCRVVLTKHVHDYVENIHTTLEKYSCFYQNVLFIHQQEFLHDAFVMKHLCMIMSYT
jgi:hypothetical protein